MADVSLTFALIGLAGVPAELGKLTAAFDGIGAKAEATSAKLKTLSESTGKLGQELSLLAIPAALIGGTMIKSGADFERSMNMMQITTHATAEQMVAATKVVRDLGTETTFSSTQAADALNMLLRNNVSLKDALGGTLQATVQLAAATGSDLAGAADTVSSAMQAFGFQAADAGKATDVLYNASIASKFSLLDMGTSMSFAQRAAIGLHINFDDLAAALATTSFMFKDASTNGTSMSDFLTRMQPQSKEAEKVMIQLGLATADGTSKFINARGEFIGFGAAATLLQDKLGKLTVAQQQQALVTIFGQQGVATANALMIKGADAVDQNKAAVDRWGTTAEAATKMMNTFWGAIDRLGGAVDDVGNALLASGFIGGLTWLINNLANLISWFANWNSTLINLVAVLASVFVALGPLLLAFSQLTKMGALVIDTLVGVRDALVAVEAATWVALGPFAALAAGVAALSAVFLYFKDDILAAFHESLVRVFPVIQELGSWISWLAGLVGITLPASVQNAAASVGQWIMRLGQHVAAVPDDIEQHMAGVQNSLVNPFAKAIPAATQHIDHLGKSTEDMAKKAEEAFNKASAAATKMADEQIKAITKTEAPLEDQVLALGRLGKTLEGLGKEGAAGVEKVNTSLHKIVEDGAVKQIDFITNRLNISLEEQRKRVGDLGTDFDKYGKFGKEGEDKIFDAAVRLNDEIARNQISKITSDATLTLEAQHEALQRVYFDYVDMGPAGVDAAKMAAAALEENNQKLNEQHNILVGVAAALVQNGQQWGGWGTQAKQVVTDFTSGATDALTTFFLTGEVSTEAFAASFLAYIADMAAKFIVHMIVMGLQAQFFGHSTFLAGVEAALGFHTATTGAVTLDLALSPILIVVIAIAAAMALLYLAGVDLGGIFKWIADIVGTVLKGAFQAFTAVLAGLVGIFEALVNVMSVFVGWIRTIGDELGKGDLKDLLKMFSGKGLFDAIGGGLKGILGGIGGFFGGLFAEGGWVPGQGGVPIVAHGGEFVVSADAAARNARLLEMINGGMAAHANVQTLGDVTHAAVTSRGGSYPGGGGGDGGITVHLHGSVISDGLSTSQVGRTLGRSIRKEAKRLYGTS